MVPLKNINVNKLVYDSQKFKTSFEINPLDINLSKIQENLTKRLEREMCEYGDFAPVVERYESENPLREFSTIKISCDHDRESISKTVRNLNLSVKDKVSGDEYVCTLKKGFKHDIEKYVANREFFDTTKKVILMIDETIKSSRK